MSRFPWKRPREYENRATVKIATMVSVLKGNLVQSIICEPFGWTQSGVRLASGFFVYVSVVSLRKALSSQVLSSAPALQMRYIYRSRFNHSSWHSPTLLADAVQENSKNREAERTAYLFCWMFWVFRSLFTAHRFTLTGACIRPWLVHEGTLKRRFMVKSRDRRISPVGRSVAKGREARS